ncbi:hypothetical protein [Nostoc sp.]|uniref:hypothetical protein n=1 Tax=Nostoc sp. TaxID=1180 RepID=UPI002FF92AB6
MSRGNELAADWEKVLAWQKKTRAKKQTLYEANKKTQAHQKVLMKIEKVNN